MMKTWTMVFLLAAVGATAQDAPKQSAAEAMMAQALEAAKPVAEHQLLAELSGAWKVMSRFWFDPSQEPLTATGTASGAMILGGRFLQLNTKMSGGLGGEAMSLFGFDRRTSEYTLIGVDTHGTYSISAAGKQDDARKGIVLHGNYADPSDGSEQKFRFVLGKPSANEHLLTLYFVKNGQDVRVAETRFAR